MITQKTMADVSLRIRYYKSLSSLSSLSLSSLSRWRTHQLSMELQQRQQLSLSSLLQSSSSSMSRHSFFSTTTSTTLTTPIKNQTTDETKKINNNNKNPNNKNKNNHYDILIVGGGVTGSTMACEITRKIPSLRVGLLDSRSSPPSLNDLLLNNNGSGRSSVPSARAYALSPQSLNIIGKNVVDILNNVGRVAQYDKMQVCVRRIIDMIFCDVFMFVL